MNNFQYYYKQIMKWDEHRTFPEFDLHKFVEHYTKYPLFMFSEYKYIENQNIDIDLIKGNNWAFEERKTRGAYPKTNKLLSLLRGYLKNEFVPIEPNGIPPVDIAKINGEYFLEEGNHRLYLSKVLERKTLYVNIIDYDYEELLKTSFLEKKPWGYYIVVKNSVYDVSEEQAISYEKIKKDMLENNTK